MRGNFERGNRLLNGFCYIHQSVVYLFIKEGIVLSISNRCFVSKCLLSIIPVNSEFAGLPSKTTQSKIRFEDPGR